MSLSGKGGVLHKSGGRLPLVSKRNRRERYALDLAHTLRRSLEAPGMSTKRIMGWTDAGERTVKGWLSASSGPRGDHLIELMRASDLVFARVLLLAGRDVVDHQRVSVLREQLATLRQTVESLIEKIDVLEAVRPSPRKSQG
jgi:hypothetical protein